MYSHTIWELRLVSLSCQSAQFTAEHQACFGLSPAVLDIHVLISISLFLPYAFILEASFLYCLLRNGVRYNSFELSAKVKLTTFSSLLCSYSKSAGVAAIVLQVRRHASEFCTSCIAPEMRHFLISFLKFYYCTVHCERTRGHRTTLWSQFSPSCMWVLEIEPR